MLRLIADRPRPAGRTASRAALRAGSAVCALFAPLLFAGPLAGQEASGAPFTEDQATSGAEIYGAKCAMCHGPELAGMVGPPLVGRAFRTNWYAGDRTLGDLFAHITEFMPMSAPGSLTPEQYAAVTAFLLAKNGHPPGEQELTPDAEALAAFLLTPVESDEAKGGEGQ